MNQTTALSILVLLLLSTCQTYEVKPPGPVTVNHYEPGALAFTVRQYSMGQSPKLKVDSMNIKLQNQSVKSIREINYSVRSFRGGVKDFSNLDYWVEGFHQSLIKTKDTAVDELSNAISQIISYDNLEVDLINYISIDGGKKLISTPYSGQYGGTFTVVKDSTTVSFGQHLTWIDFKGQMVTYLDHGSSPWISVTGQVVPEDNLYGQVNYSDTTISFTSNITENQNEFVIEFEIDTINNYHFTLNLN
jgi:hypothetical protein